MGRGKLATSHHFHIERPSNLLGSFKIMPMITIPQRELTQRTNWTLQRLQESLHECESAMSHPVCIWLGIQVCLAHLSPCMSACLAR